MDAPALRQDYQSPRWSAEILDCSLPMSLDTYSACSYRCLYCFSFNQKAIGIAAGSYLSNTVRSINVARLKKMFTEPFPGQFGPYIRERRMFQWGGLSDAFDEYERQFGVTLDLLRFFRDIQYPISFSTKGTWWTQDQRYQEAFAGASNWHIKVSMITLDEERARKVEVLCPTPKERLAAMARLAKMGLAGVTLRLRPFIIGVSTRDFDALIAAAADNGADSVSTEFMCLETRNPRTRPRYEVMSRLVGIDLLKMYQAAGGSGYLRLNRAIKRPYMEAMAESCEKHGLRFYVSDAHFKEMCANGSCCGVKPGMPYSTAQFTEALLIAKAKGRVRFCDVYAGREHQFNYIWERAEGFNTAHSEKRAQFDGWTMLDWIKYHWNNVESLKSPARYFGGVLRAVEIDEDGNVVYEYRPNEAESTACVGQQA
jgi:DNA repair photolyase